MNAKLTSGVPGANEAQNCSVCVVPGRNAVPGIRALNKPGIEVFGRYGRPDAVFWLHGPTGRQGPSSQLKSKVGKWAATVSREGVIS